SLSRNLAEVPCRESKAAQSPCDQTPLPTLARLAAHSRFRKLGRLASSLVAKMPSSLPGYATASGLIAASLAMVFFGSPQDLGWFGVYRRVQSRPAVTETVVTGDDAQRDESQSRLDQVESDIGQAWKSIDAGGQGGTSEAMKRAIVSGVTTSLVAR
ncbi:MAG TPA: hypothetical protein VI756_08245, partial [Blastocatellia bacterium]